MSVSVAPLQMTFKIFILVIICAVTTLGYVTWSWVRRGPPALVNTDNLSFPCLRMIDGIIWDRIDGARDLAEMHSNLFMNRKDDPLIIDSQFHVFEMSRLDMKGSTLGLMITGPRQVEVVFDLIARRDISPEEATTMLKASLSQKASLSDDRKQAIKSAKSLKDFLELLEFAAPIADPR